jgi:hypothetical protein
MSFYQSKTYSWALTGIFSAIHFDITIIPFSLAIGVQGVISLGMISGPLVGFLLGPFYGTIAVLIGSILAMFANPLLAVLGPFTPIATASGALAAGLFRTGKPIGVTGIHLLSVSMVPSDSTSHITCCCDSKSYQVYFFPPRYDF